MQREIRESSAKIKKKKKGKKGEKNISQSFDIRLFLRGIARKKKKWKNESELLPRQHHYTFDIHASQKVQYKSQYYDHKSVERTQREGLVGDAFECL